MSKIETVVVKRDGKDVVINKCDQDKEAKPKPKHRAKKAK